MSLKRVWDFSFLSQTLTYDEHLLGSIPEMLSRVPYLCWMMNIVSSPFLPLLREFCSFLLYFGFPQDTPSCSPYDSVWHLEMPSPKELPRIGWNFSLLHQEGKEKELHNSPLLHSFVHCSSNHICCSA